MKSGKGGGGRARELLTPPFLLSAAILFKKPCATPHAAHPSAAAYRSPFLCFSHTDSLSPHSFLLMDSSLISTYDFARPSVRPVTPHVNQSADQRHLHLAIDIAVPLIPSFLSLLFRSMDSRGFIIRNRSGGVALPRDDVRMCGGGGGYQIASFMSQRMRSSKWIEPHTPMESRVELGLISDVYNWSKACSGCQI